MSTKPTERSFRIDPWHQIAFDAITANSDSIGLIPCRIGGEASACIVTGRQNGPHMEFMPLFVAMTPGLDVIFPHDREGGEGGGGPKRPRQSAARAFALNKATVTAAHG